MCILSAASLNSEYFQDYNLTVSVDQARSIPDRRNDLRIVLAPCRLYTGRREDYSFKHRSNDGFRVPNRKAEHGGRKAVSARNREGLDRKNPHLTSSARCWFTIVAVAGLRSRKRRRATGSQLHVAEHCTHDPHICDVASIVRQRPNSLSSGTPPRPGGLAPTCLACCRYSP